MKRPLLTLVTLLLLCLPAMVSGHGMPVDATVNFQASGRHAHVELLDPYQNPVPTAKVKAALTGPAEKPRLWSPLIEGEMGIYEGEVLPTGDAASNTAGAMLHLVAEFPEEKWVSQIVLPASGVLENKALKLVHIDIQGPMPWYMIIALVLAAGAVVYGVWDFFAGQRREQS